MKLEKKLQTNSLNLWTFKKSRSKSRSIQKNASPTKVRNAFETLI